MDTGDFIFNGTDIRVKVPDLDFTLASALALPELAAQWVASDWLECEEAHALQPLEDVKDWLRGEHEAGRSKDHLDLLALLMADEFEARAAADRGEGEFDPLEWALAEMDSDETYATFDPDSLRRMLSLVLDNADELAGWCQAQNGLPLSLGLSFRLPHPLHHPRLSADKVAMAQARFGGRMPSFNLDKRLLEAELLIEISDGAPLPLERGDGTGTLRLPVADDRCGDTSRLALGLVYPQPLEGYCLAVFEAMAKDFSLKPEA